MQVLKEEILKLREEGKTHREISEYYGLKDKFVVKEFLKRERRKSDKIQFGIKPAPKGRRPKWYIKSELEKDYEIKRLKMENELLRDFLKEAERGRSLALNIG